jgi:hypothetical protein
MCTEGEASRPARVPGLPNAYAADKEPMTIELAWVTTNDVIACVRTDRGRDTGGKRLRIMNVVEGAGRRILFRPPYAS